MYNTSLIVVVGGKQNKKEKFDERYEREEKINNDG